MMQTTGATYIISLKFAPGLKKEFHLIGESIRKHGANVVYILSDKYVALGEEMPGTIYIRTGEGIFNIFLETVRNMSLKNIFSFFIIQPPSFVLFYNPHPLNPLFARKLKSKFPDIRAAMFLHDPYKQDKKKYGSSKSVFYCIAEWIQALTLRGTDVVISPSEYSSQLLKKRFPRHKNVNVVVPLMIPDMIKPSKGSRKYFSIVGNAHKATGHNRFVELVNYVALKEMNFSFAIISSSNNDSFLKKIDKTALSHVSIINKKIITDAEINEVVSQSYAVFRLDEDITQSGVLPVCYMNKTPVIVSNCPGLVQHVQHGFNGYVLSAEYSNEDLIIAMDFVKSNFDELSSNARDSYEKLWSYKNWEKYYSWLIDLLEIESR